MDENKKIREVKVVGYSRELLFLQLTILVSIFSLLGVAVSDGWWRMPFVVCFLCLFGFSLFQASRLHRKGVTISICNFDDSGDTPADDEENQDPADDEIGPDEEVDTGEDEDSLDKLHWTETSYPDPDIELGLKNRSPTGHEQSVRNGNSEVDTQTAKGENNR